MSRLLRLVLAICAAAVMSGCVAIPDSGPVESSDLVVRGEGEGGGRFTPQGPQPGESKPEIVGHFFEAMTAIPMSATVAREFLTEEANATWRPENGYLTYETRVLDEGLGNQTVRLTGVNRFDANGRWIGPGRNADRSIEIPLEADEDGQWRITDFPDALVVSQAWFENSTTPMSVYFFDPDGTTLVPEIVFVPAGDQQAGLLIRALLAGPIDRRMERTLIPDETQLRLSVTVAENGVAEVPLVGDVGAARPETIYLMAAQIAWTLRQIPSITAVRVTFDGRPITVLGSTDPFDVEVGSGYDPAGIDAGNEMYGLLDGKAVRVSGDEAQPLPGMFGSRSYGLASVSVSLDNTRIAGVTEAGRDLIETSVDNPDAPARTVLSGAADLLPARWDAQGRLWAIDRRPDGAVVWAARDGRPEQVDVPGITGEQVLDYLVSRDGTRLIAAVRGRGGDRIMVSRIRPTGSTGTPTGAPAEVLVADADERLRIRAIGWRSTTSIVFLRALPGRQSELRSALVDGSPARLDPDAVLGDYADRDTRIVGSPRPGESIYLRANDGSYEPYVEGLPSVPPGITALTYVG